MSHRTSLKKQPTEETTDKDLRVEGLWSLQCPRDARVEVVFNAEMTAFVD
jgi:hypothetical protein